MRGLVPKPDHCPKRDIDGRFGSPKSVSVAWVQADRVRRLQVKEGAVSSHAAKQGQAI